MLWLMLQAQERMVDKTTTLVSLIIMMVLCVVLTSLVLFGGLT